jgi:hypothetical protein
VIDDRGIDDLIEAIFGQEQNAIGVGGDEVAGRDDVCANRGRTMRSLPTSLTRALEDSAAMTSMPNRAASGSFVVK